MLNNPKIQTLPIAMAGMSRCDYRVTIGRQIETSNRKSTPTSKPPIALLGDERCDPPPTKNCSTTTIARGADLLENACDSCSTQTPHLEG